MSRGLGRNEIGGFIALIAAFLLVAAHAGSTAAQEIGTQD